MTDIEAKAQRELDAIPQLRKLVTPYDGTNTNLPSAPDGKLFGIWFIYDEDRDDRVLVAIDQLKHLRQIVAVHEHEGGLTIYANTPTGLDGDELELCYDNWPIKEILTHDDLLESTR